MNGLDLFSGIGGIGLALEPWVRTVAYCERDRYAQGVLLSRMRSGDIDKAPIWDDVTTLRADMLPRIDIIFGGFPCQDLSVAGRGKGLAGERSGLFFEIIRLVKELSPRFVFLENVPAIRTRGLSEVVNALTEIGYDCRWTCLSAGDVGAPHKRERWFLLAHAKSEGLESNRNSGGIGEGISSKGFPMSSIDGGISNVAHTNSLRSPSQSVGDVRELAETSGGKEETRDQSSVCTSARSSKMANSMCDGLSSSEVRQSIGKSNDRNQTWQNWSTIPERRSEIMGIEQSSEVADSMCEGLEGQRQESSGVREEFNHSCDNSWWAVEPDLGGVIDGFSSWMDRLDLSHSHKLILNYGTTNKERPSKILQELSDSIFSQENRKSIGRQGSVSSEEVLFSYLCKLQETSKALDNMALESKEVQEVLLRKLFDGKISSCSSLRWGPKKQHERKHSDSLQTLSWVLAQHSEKAWSSYRRSDATLVRHWESGIARTANGVSNRVDRIKCLGNSVVPLQVQTAFKKLAGIY